MLLRVHRWSGLLIGVVVAVIGVTGALTTYQDEIDRSLNPELFRVKRLPVPVRTLDEAIAAAEAARQDAKATSVRLPRSRRDSLEVSVSPHGSTDFTGWYVYVDPYRNNVLGSRPFDPDPWSRRGAVASLYEVHYSLAASRAGVWFVSAVASVWLVTTLLGVVLAWPASRAAWRRTVRIRFGGSAAQLNLDLHRATGLLAAAFIIVVLATGIALNLSPQATAVVQSFSTLTFEPALPEPRRSASGSVIAWQTALDAAVEARPEDKPQSIYRDDTRGVYVVRMREPDAIHRRGQTRVYVDASNADVLATWNPRDGSAGDRFWSWQNPLHSGHAFGGVGRFIVFLTGLAAALFVCTGVPLWFARRRSRGR